MTTVREIPKSAVSGAIKVVRLPADTVLRAAPERLANPAQFAVDSADAAVRGAAGRVLGDSDLQQEAERLRTAVDERRRAFDLRGARPSAPRRPRERTEKARTEAERRRRRADAEAEKKRKQARKRREQKRSEAQQAESRRKQNAKKAAAAKQRKGEEKAQERALEALEVRSEALEQRDEALVAEDESARLKRATERVKSERKAQSERTESNGQG